MSDPQPDQSADQTATQTGVATVAQTGTRSVIELDSTVCEVVARQLRLPTQDLTGELQLIPHLDLTETARPRLLIAMGEALDATFPDDFLDGVRTVADLTSAVRISLRA